MFISHTKALQNTTVNLEIGPGTFVGFFSSAACTHQAVHDLARVVQDIKREDDGSAERVEVALPEAEDGHHEAPYHQDPQRGK